MKKTRMIKEAMQQAFEFHRDSIDINGMPYIYHCISVAEQMNDEEDVVVAFLHDVYAKTEGSFVIKGFNDRINDALLLFSKADGDRAEFLRSIKENPISRRVMIADIKDNLDINRREFVNKDIFAQFDVQKKELEYLEADDGQV